MRTEPANLAVTAIDTRPGRFADLQDAAVTVALATAAIAFVPLLHTASVYLAVIVVIILACAIVLIAPSLAAPVAIFSLVYQSLFVSIFSPIIDPADMEFTKGYNFLLCATMWAAAAAAFILDTRRFPRVTRKFMFGGFAVLAVTAVYYAIGAQHNALAATVYLRNVIFPLILFQLCLLTSPVRMNWTAIIVIGVLAVVLGYVEFAFRDFWMEITNGTTYWKLDELKAIETGAWEKEMKATGRVIVEFRDRFSVSFLNTPLLDELGFSTILRIFGPNISAISFAYLVAAVLLLAASLGRWLLALACIPLLVLCGVKGALILTLFVAAGLFAAWLFGYRLTLFGGLVAAACYTVVGIYVGLAIGDYHVLGFMGGWNGLPYAPFGRGLGVGGNLSGDFADIDWSAAQAAGAVDFAVESAIGVLLYQMGVLALVPLAYYGAIALEAWRRYAATAQLIYGFVALGLLITLVNGLFQEEALFAPLALGLLAAFAGLVIGQPSPVGKTARAS